jgi:hypothetical protein
MAAIGNSPTQQAFTPAIDYFSGNGSTTAFTLSRPVASVAQVQVTIDNVAQNPSSAFTVSSNTITFTSAPLSGTNNIYVYYTSPITQVIAPGQGTVTSDSFGTITNFTTTGNTVLGDATTDTLTVGVTGLVKDSTGKVGIGTASPNDVLEVAGNDAFIRINRTANEPGIDMRVSGSSTNKGVIAVTTGGAMYFTSGGNTERMRIDSSGRITTPYQPYCLVTPPASFTVSASTEVIVNGTWAASTNIGSNFATSGGIFTAPIAGVYQIEWTAFFNASAANRMDVFIYLNGSIIARKEQQKWATNSNNNSSQITATLLLAASDQIKFGVFSSSATTLFSTGQPWQYASVILLG